MSSLLHAFYDISIEKAGKTFNRDGSNGAIAFPEFFNSIDSISIKVKSSEITTIDVGLSPSYNDALTILRSGILGIGVGSKDQTPSLAGKSKAAAILGAATNVGSLVAGFTGASNPAEKSLLKDLINGVGILKIKLFRDDVNTKSTSVYSGPMLQPDVEFSGGLFSIKLKMFGYMSYPSGPEYITQIKEDMTIKDIVNGVLGLVGMEYSIAEGHSGDVNSALNTKATPRNLKESPFQTLKWALGLGRIRFYENPEKEKSIVLYKEDTALKKPKTPKYTFVVYKQVNPEENVYPCYSFSMTGNKLLFMKSGSFGNYNAGILEDTKRKSLTDKKSDKDLKELERSSSTIKPIDNSKAIPGFLTPVIDDSEESKQAGKNEVAASVAKFQRIQMTVPGLPDLFPLQSINIEVGDVKELTAVALITGVTHSFGSESWTTELETVITGDLSQDLNSKIAPQVKSINNDGSSNSLLSRTARPLV